jgi:flagellar protein FliO/FliZ
MDFGFGDYLQFFFALVFVLALIALVALIARKMGFGYRLPSRGRKTRRLEVVEMIPLDARRRLVLVRRDAAEYLVLLGINSDLLLDGAIPAPAGEFNALLSEAMTPAGKPDAPR